MNFTDCADDAIDAFAKGLGNGYYPRWYDLIPYSTQFGWAANFTEWSGQARDIISSFEECSGVRIGFDPVEVDHLGNLTLAECSEYLVEKAEQSATQVLLAFAESH